MTLPKGFRRVPGAFRAVRSGGVWQWQCAGCDRTAWTGATNCPHCNSPWIVRKARRRRRDPDPDARIHARLAAATRAHDAALDDLLRAANRLAKARARLSRLRVAADTPLEERRARARRALETRQLPRSPRAIRVRDSNA